MSSQINPSRQITAGYVLALSIVAVLALAVHVILDRVIVNQSNMADVLSTAAEQRTLVQQTALLADQYVQGQVDLRADLQNSVDLIMRNHRRLTTGDLELRIGDRAEQVSQLYFAEPTTLDGRVRRFVDNVSLMAELPPQQAINSVPYAMILDDAANGLDENLNQALDIYAAESTARIATLRTAQRMVLGVIILTLLCEAIFIFRPLARRMKDYSEKLYELANRDSLTGCANRRYFMELADDEVVKSRRYRRPLTFLMLDIDKFKSINDTYGHSVGDEAIRGLVRTCQNHLRRVDHMGRLGGEEFAVMLPETDVEGATIVAEKLRKLVEQQIIEYAEAKLSYTVSIGAAQMRPADPQQTLAVILNEADEALYAAKNGGRNRVIAYSGPGLAETRPDQSSENAEAAATA